MSICYLGIGSNLGNRKQNIRRALERIGQLKGTKILKLSKISETKPVGGPGGQRDYLNACLKLDTTLSPHFLLKELKTIEKELGRKKSARFGPRPIDLDILLFENKIINRKELKIPHPRMFERDFVLKPLAEIL
jgi:2-amino-4-hydroxy-6-hydroxymethyldihydropteridine diphosphokinase